MKVSTPEVKMIQFLELPEDVLFEVMGYLSEADLFRLGGCCRYLHILIHQNDLFWRKRAKPYGLKILDTEKLNDSETMANCRGIVYDRSLRGYKELCLLRSGDYYQVSLQRIRKSSGSIPNFTAILGPGIDSRNNSDIIRKILDYQDKRFQLKSPDIRPNWTRPGGIVGAGVWFVLDNDYQFILRCLHTNSQTIRESVTGSQRLQTQFNKLLSKDIPINHGSTTQWEFLHKDIVDIFGSVHALIYTIDVSPDVVFLVEAKPWKYEFDAFIAALKKTTTPDVPLLFLCLYNDHGNHEYGKSLEKSNLMAEIFTQFDLHNFNRPLGVFFVNTRNTIDIAVGFEWLLYRLKKDRSELEYHKTQSQRTF